MVKSPGKFDHQDSFTVLSGHRPGPGLTSGGTDPGALLQAVTPHPVAGVQGVGPRAGQRARGEAAQAVALSEACGFAWGLFSVVVPGVPDATVVYRQLARGAAYCMFELGDIVLVCWVCSNSAEPQGRDV